MREDEDRLKDGAREKARREPLHGWELLAQRCLWISFFCSAGVIVYGSCLNSTGLKYSRVSTHSRNGDECQREMMVLSIERSNFCCEGLRSSDWVCVAAYDEANRKMTSIPWAYVFPLFPWALTLLLMETFTGLSYEAARKRCYFYVGLLLYRTYVLYIAFGYAQKAYTKEGGSDRNGGTCWYSIHRRDGNCVDHFDFSDHIIFYVAQMMIPAALEIGYVLGFNRASRRWKHWLLMLPSILASLVLLFFALRAMMFTSIYFHTPKENMVALMLVLLFAVLPTSIVLQRKTFSARAAP